MPRRVAVYEAMEWLCSVVENINKDTFSFADLPDGLRDKKYVLRLRYLDVIKQVGKRRGRNSGIYFVWKVNVEAVRRLSKKAELRDEWIKRLNFRRDKE